MTIKKQNKIINKILFFCLLIFLISCQNFSLKNETEEKNMPAPALSTQGLEDGRLDKSKAASGETKTTSEDQIKDNKKHSTQATTNRYIIRSASIDLFAISVFESVKTIEKIATRFEGFISDSTLNNAEGGRPSATLTLRVPEENFDKAIELIEKIGTITNKNIKGEDITTEFVDTQAQLRNLQKQEQQYLKILEQAYTIKDILAVTKELTNVRGQIEKITSRLKQLSNLVDLSTITVSLSEKTQTGIANIWDFSPTVANAWVNATTDLAYLIKKIITGVTGFIVYVPVLLILIVILWIAWRLSYKILVDKRKIISKRVLNYIFIGICLFIAGVIYPFLFVIFVSIFLIALMIHFVLWLIAKFTKKENTPK